MNRITKIVRRLCLRPTAGRRTSTSPEPAAPAQPTLRRRRGRALFVGAVLAAGAATATLTPAVAGAATPGTARPAHAQTAPTASRGFDFVNLSSRQLTFRYYSGPGDVALPGIGDVLKPGARQHAEMVWWLFGKNWKLLDWTDPNGQYTRARIELTLDGWQSIAAGDPGEGMEIRVSGGTMYFLDVPGTVVSIPPELRQKQAETLQQLCQNTDLATCTFTPTKREQLHTPAEVLYTTEVNDTSQPQRVWAGYFYVNRGAAMSTDNTISGKLLDTLRKALRTPNVDPNWVTGFRFQNINQWFTIQPGTYQTLNVSTPVWRDTGDFTITMGSTTWVVFDVDIDTPDPNQNKIRWWPEEFPANP